MAHPQSYPGTPRWVKICAVAVLISIVLFVAVHLVGGDPPHLMNHGEQQAPK